ncbi:hepatic lectin-like [Patiria miniata]|uniref:C-type lectin domain-containing protein n=1 Tax=Patiria miniata TaxID=46514 RepID=A0A913ZT72_PATMI|nr:hepatic lectin-like [Patiria miniata]
MVSKWFIFGLISLHLMGCAGGNEMCKASIGHGWACPPTWYQWGRKCYKAMITEPMTWFEAKEECIKMGSVLVVPLSQEETDFLMLLVPESSSIWINCNDLEKEGTWKCQDGTDEVELRTWPTKGRQPSNSGGDEHCAEIRPNGIWNDNQCTRKRPAICIHPAPQLHEEATVFVGCQQDMDTLQ